MNDGIDCNELAYESRSGVLIDLSVFKKPSDFYFLMKILIQN